MTHRLIIISGTPGVGKSHLAIQLARALHYERFDLSAHYKALSVGYNRKKQCYDIDLKKFAQMLKTRKKQVNLVVDSHIAQLLPPSLVDVCIIIRCNLKVLKTRLEARGYSKAKVQENLESEIFGICEEQAQKHYTLLVGQKPGIRKLTAAIKHILKEHVFSCVGEHRPSRRIL